MEYSKTGNLANKLPTKRLPTDWIKQRETERGK